MVRALSYAALAAVCIVLCAACDPATSAPPVEREPAPAHVERFDAPEPPIGFDAERARMPLAEIPGDPPAPPPPVAAEPAGLPKRGAQHLKEARRLLSEQRYSETIGELEKALRYDPDHVECHELMCLASLLAGNQAQAVQWAERLLKIAPDDMVGHYVEARLLAAAGKEDPALAHYRAALKCPSRQAGPGFTALVRYYLGTLLFNEGYYAAAVEQLSLFDSAVAELDETAIDQLPELATIVRVQRGQTVVRMAEAYTLLGNHAAAADALLRAVQAQPEDEALREACIEALVRADRFGEAEQQAVRFVEDTSGSRQAVELLLDLYRHVGEDERGVEAVKAIVDRHPDNVELWMLYAEALAGAERYDDAAAALREVMQRHPDADEPRWKLIALYREQGAWSDWIAALAGEVARVPEDERRTVNELRSISPDVVRRILEDSDEMLGAVKAREGAPDAQATLEASVLYLFGRLSDRIDRLSEARSYYESALQRDPTFMPATVGVAEMYVERNQWKEALAVIERAQADREKPAAALERLAGQCHDGLDEIEKAVARYEKALQLDRDDTRTMMLLGQLYDRVGELEKGQRQYQAALAVDPDDLLAREALIRNKLHQIDREMVARKKQQEQAKVLSELLDMSRLDSDAPPTVRCEALCSFRFDADVTAEEYAARLRKLVEAHPEDNRSRLDLSSALLFLLLDWQSADVQIDLLLAADPYSAEYNEYKAIVLMKLLRYDEAEAQFDRMLEWFPNRLMWWRSLAQLHMTVQDYDEAEQVWRRLIDTAENAQQRRVFELELLRTMLAAHEFQTARETVQAWIDNEKDEALRQRYRELLLGVYKQSRDYDEYLAQCREWAQAKEHDPKAQAMLMDALTLADRYDEALALAVESMGADQATVRDSLAVQRILLSADRFDEAIELAVSELAGFEQAQQRLMGMRWLAGLYGAAGQHDKAIEIHRDIVSLIPEKAGQQALYEAQMGLAMALMRGKEFDESIALMDRMIEQADSDSTRVDLIRQLASVHQRQGRPDLAEERLREAHEMTPRDVGINNDLGYTLAEAGKNLDEAERMVRLAVGEQPRNAAFLDSLGWVLYRKGDFVEAEKWLSRSAGLEEGLDPVIFDHLGDVRWRLGEQDAAVASWKKALELHADSVGAGGGDKDDPLVGQVQAKLDAAAAGEQPAVAEVATSQASNEKAQ